MSLPSASRSHWFYPASTRILLALLPVLFPAQVAFAPRPAPPNANTESTTSQRGINLEGEQIQQAQIASVTLSSTGFKLVARQLIDSRTPAGYAKVESFALRNPNSISADLAWLVAGYAHILDHDYAKAIAALKQPRPAVTLVDDYIAYFLATCYAANGDNAGVVQTLQNFDRDWPESLLIGDATVLLANASLALGNPQAAIVPLEKYRQPFRADIELALARAYLSTGQTIKAVQILRSVYYETPTSHEASDAGEILAKIPTRLLSPPRFDERMKRADAFLRAHRYGDAAREYRALLRSASGADGIKVALSLGQSLRQMHRYSEAQAVLATMSGLSDEFRAQQLYELLELACAEGHEEQAQKLVLELRRQAPDATSINRGLLLIAAMYLRKKDYTTALSLYREIGPVDDPQAHSGHWRATWLHAQHSLRETKRDLEDQIAFYPESPEVAAALYWLARLAETESDLSAARTYYENVIRRFPGYYYAVLSNQELNKLRGKATVLAAYPEIEEFPLRRPRFTSPESLTRPSDPRAKKAEILQECGLTKFAVRELQALAIAAGPSDWITNTIAVFYQEAGRYDLAMETIKRSVPGYLGSEFRDLPKPYADVLFPRAYWNELKFWSETYHLDPFLVAAVVRQESEFNAAAVSRANALGLMQLLPTTGQQIARRVGVPIGSHRQLLSPELNLQLGAFFLRQLLDDYHGHLEYALAAYNAGKGRVQEWLAGRSSDDAPEFVESIPFTETREYVQAVVRNASIYQRLYGSP